jgi:surface antigen
LAVALVAALGCGACSSVYSLSSMLPGFNEDRSDVATVRKEDATGSLSLREPTPSFEMTNADWAIAKAALREALARTEDGGSVEWQNPITMSRGSVNPVAAAFEQDGFHCRNFLVSHRRGDKEAWYEGTACRIHRGQWDVRSTRPVRKT